MVSTPETGLRRPEVDSRPLAAAESEMVGGTRQGRRTEISSNNHVNIYQVVEYPSD
jgi:hypothetical protein